MADTHVLMIVSDHSFRMGFAAKGLERAREHAAGAGYRVEVTVLPLHACAGTTDWLRNRRPEDWQVLPDAQDDLAMAIAAWAAGCTAEQLTLLDPDDLVCHDWFTACATRAAAPEACWFPQALMTYGPNFFTRGETALIRLPASLGAASASDASHPMPARFVAPRAVIARHPFPQSEPQRGWGQAGWNEIMRWWWVNRLLTSGVAFHAIESTVHYRALADGADAHHLTMPAGGDRLGPYMRERSAPLPLRGPDANRPLPETNELTRTVPRVRWQHDVSRLHEDVKRVADYLRDVEEARDWFRGQSERWEAEARRLAAS